MSKANQPTGPAEIHINFTEAQLAEIMHHGELVEKLRNATTNPERAAALLELMGAPEDAEEEKQRLITWYDELDKFDFTQE
jgi:hypothetical protein